MISEVFNTDCLAYMDKIPNNYFDLAIADPPYGINAPNMRMGENNGYESTAKRCRKGRLNQGAGKNKNRALNAMSCDWDYYPPSQRFFDELMRVSKNQIIWGGNYFNLPPTRCVVCWDKEQPWDNFSQIELAWTSFNKPAKIFRKGVSGGSVANMVSNPKIHPTQKPVELYAYLLRTFATPGCVIFDPMMGSQSSRIAAYKLGYDFYGCEINEDYFLSGNVRFEKECHGVEFLINGKRVIQQELFEL